MITFLTTIFLDIDIVLCCGFLALLFLNTYKTQAMNVVELGQVKDFEIFTDIHSFNTHELNHLKIIRPSQSLLYVNCDDFHKKLNSLCPLKVSNDKKTLIDQCIANYSCKSDEDEDQHLDKTKCTVKAIILDFSLVVYIDESGAKELIKIVHEYENNNINILFASVNGKFFSLSLCFLL